MINRLACNCWQNLFILTKRHWPLSTDLFCRPAYCICPFHWWRETRVCPKIKASIFPRRSARLEVGRSSSWPWDKERRALEHQTFAVFIIPTRCRFRYFGLLRVSGKTLTGIRRCVKTLQRFSRKPCTENESLRAGALLFNGNVQLGLAFSLLLCQQQTSEASKSPSRVMLRHGWSQTNAIVGYLRTRQLLSSRQIKNNATWQTCANETCSLCLKRLHCIQENKITVNDRQPEWQFRTSVGCKLSFFYNFARKMQCWFTELDIGNKKSPERVANRYLRAVCKFQNGWYSAPVVEVAVWGVT